MSSRRTKVRKSLLALLVSYLRDGTVDTSKFTTVAGVGGSYPFMDEIWTFTIGSELYQITQYEHFHYSLPLGVTVQFAGDVASSSHAMPRFFTLGVQVTIRMPIKFSGESDAQKIALKIDQALYRVSGKVEIKDYDVNPTVGTGMYLEWQTTQRNEWKFEDTKGMFEEMAFVTEMKYQIPKEEW